MPTEFDPREVATLIVNGREYTEWESIWVQERWTESFSYFRFTANEGRLQPRSWRELQFKPFDKCQVTLGGQPIINGRIITRQATATATQHMVQHTGKSYGFWPYKSTAWTEDGDMSGKNFEQIATILLKDWGGYDKVGTINPKPWEKQQVDKSMTIWDYLEKLARERGIVMGVHRSGRPLLIGKHTGDIIGFVADGQNILQIQCTISIENFMQDYFVDTSEPGDDQKSGEQTNRVQGHAKGEAPEKSVLVIPAENPGDKDAANDRAAYEKQWCQASEITCNVTVPGWFAQNGMLWEAGKDVSVFSPMAMITQVLKINTATFEQDNNKGTVTTLELVAPWGRNDSINANVSKPTEYSPSVRNEPSPDGAPTNEPAKTGSGASTQPTLGQQLGEGSIGFAFPDQTPQ